MLSKFSGILDKNISFLILLTFFFSILIYFPMPWDEPIEDSITSLKHKIRGHRLLEENFVVVYIGDEDLKALGGWPITRDYYSYLIHILNFAGAKTIAIDLLFAKDDTRHPEFDQTFSTFLQSSGNVCLPMVFSELVAQEFSNYGTPVFSGDNPTYPLKLFQENAAAIGFSNFSKSGSMQKIPITAADEDKTLYSFGAQMALLFLNDSLDFSSNFIRLNHFGDLEQVQSISFIELLKKYSETPDSLNFDNKLVLLTVTAPGVANLKSTPLSKALPASLIHLTVAENLVNKNYLIRTSPIIQVAFLILILIACYFVNRIKAFAPFVIFSAGIIIIFWILSQFLFSTQNLIIPVFYPTLAFLTVFSYFVAARYYKKNELQSSISYLLKEQINLKENQLQEIREKLNKQENRSEEFQQLADKRNQDILQLEKDINDLKVYPSSSGTQTQTVSSFKDIVHSEDSPMAILLELVLKVSSSDIPVLIMGETGTGKELIAQAIHINSDRKNNPFIALNCSALSETLLESELFGHEKGSFTGATATRRGRFEIANGGSIFLDEISETTKAFQAKLLRVLQESTFERLGGEKTLKTNIRVIAATNKNLDEEIEQDTFRRDLFYRLNGFPVNLPPLRERLSDIPPLARFFLKKHNFEMDISEQAIAALQKYHWPGNVRELENMVHRAAIIVQSDNRTLIQNSDLDESIVRNVNTTKITTHKSLEIQILDTMRSFSFSRSSISQTAKLLGNRDRGTITEYFRGICFEHLVKANFDMDRAAQNIANSDDDEILNLVKSKINTYLENIDGKNQTTPSYKGLPKKYHPFLEKVHQHLNKK